MAKLTAILLPIAAGVGGMVLLYMYYKKDEDERVSCSDRSSKTVEIRMKIHRDQTGSVIGRGGSNIKQVEAKSGTRINFDEAEEASEYRVCIIRGKPSDCEHAKALIYQIMASLPKILTEEVWVPKKACGRIIGRNGENIRLMCKVSGATIKVQSGGVSSNGRQLVTIRGEPSGVETAKKMIDEKVAEEEEMRSQIHESANRRGPRYGARKPLLFLTMEEEGTQVAGSGDREANLSPTNNDGFMEVFVSAVDTAGRFWVQAVGPKAVELDKLVEGMTEYYNQETNRELHKLNQVNVGDIVVAPFTHDKSWYRAKVMAVETDAYSPEEAKISVYFVDYGDSEDVSRSDVYEIRTDFLRLRFQAIECYLAKVLPRGGEWSEEATDMFQELSHAAEWKVILASVIQYKEKEPGGRKVPCVELVDSSGPQDVNVGCELVKFGFAEWEKPAAAVTNENGTT